MNQFVEHDGLEAQFVGATMGRPFVRADDSAGNHDGSGSTPNKQSERL
jgi:hypothetical protein